MTEASKLHLSPGLRLDRYELLCPLARGGMAEVWAAQQHGKHGFERTVAIKTILADNATDSRARRMFLEEARLIASIRHPNVAELYDFGEERELLFMVLEYVEGDSVVRIQRAAANQGIAFPPELALRIMADACLGLHAAHEHVADDGQRATIIHRDVSPQNILCSTSGAVKLIDFGIAKVTGALHQDTTGGFKGKVYYMAPEQALGRSVDQRADLWAAGATLYKLLSGRPPYAGANELETLHLLTRGDEPPPLSSLPKEVRQITERALAYEPEDRYASADDMYRDLEATIAKLYGGVNQRDVSRWVSRVLEASVEERRRVLARAKQGAVQREALAKELESSAIVANEPTDPPVSAPARDAAATVVVGRRPQLLASAPAGRSSVKAGVLVGAALFVCVGVVAWWLSRASAVSAEVVAIDPPTPTNSVPAASPSTPVASPTATDQPVSVAEPEPEPVPEPSADPAPVVTAKPARSPVTKSAARPASTPSPLDVVKSRK